MKKSLFNFYLDDNLKKDVQAKLTRLTNDTPKGQLASLIRILLKQFNATPDEKVNPLLLQAIEAEYVYSQTLNKRSKM
jgi:hypothetical protein